MAEEDYLGKVTGAAAQNINITDILCEGPIAGLVHGPYSVYFDNAVAQNTRYKRWTPAQGYVTFDGTSSTGTIDSNVVVDEDIVSTDEQPIILYPTTDFEVRITHININRGQRTDVMLYRPQGGFNAYGGTIINITGQYSIGHGIYWELEDGSYQEELYWGFLNITSDTRATFTVYNPPDQGLLQEHINYVNNVRGDVTGFLREYQFVNGTIDSDSSSVNLATAVPAAGTYEVTTGTVVSTNSSQDGHHGSTNDFDPTIPITKIDNLYVQESTGTLNQPPLRQIANVGGSQALVGVVPQSATGEIKQILAGATSFQPIDQTGLPNIDKSDESYPGNPDLNGFTDNAPKTLVASDFGIATVQQLDNVDKITFQIQYPNGLIYYGGDSEINYYTCYAIYQVYLLFKFTGQSTFSSEKYFIWNNGIKHYGKRQGPLVFDHIINIAKYRQQLPSFDDFQVNIVRLTRSAGTGISAYGRTVERDKNKYTVVAASNIAATGALIEDVLTYPYSAVVSSTFSSRQFTKTPKRSYHIRGKLVKVPSTYTPRESTNRNKAIYDGFWDGTSYTENVYTNNPAWIFLDIITNKRYGAGKWIEDFNIDVFSLYRISKYCDELVETNNTVGASNLILGEYHNIETLGNTNWNAVAKTSGITYSVGDTIRALELGSGTGKATVLEPRYTMNLFLPKAEAVYKVIRDMAGAFHSILFWLDSQLTVVQDTPNQPVYSFSKSNVIDGKFTYESTNAKTRYNQIVVNWNDPNQNYELVPIIIEDTTNIKKIGRTITKEVVAFGCTSESQAIRFGRWHLWTSLNQKGAVTFQTSLFATYVKPGDIINIQDSDKFQRPLSGRIKSFDDTANTVTFDREVEFTGGVYTLNLTYTEPAAIYTGLDSITIDGDTYERGDYVPAAYTFENNVWLKRNLVTEARAINAHSSASGSEIPLTWKKYTHVKEYPITNPGTTTDTVSLTGSLELEGWAIGAVWNLRHQTADDVEVAGSKKTYKVMAVSVDSKNLYTISAVEHYNQKFEAVDKDYRLGVIPPSIYDSNEPQLVPPPRNFTISIIPQVGGPPTQDWVANWEPPVKTGRPANSTNTADLYEFVAGYEIAAADDLMPDRMTNLTVSQTSYIFANPPQGEYIVKVRTVSLKGNFSEWVTAEFSNIDSPSDTQPDDIEYIYGIPKFAYSNVEGSIKHISSTANSTDSEYNFNGTYHGIYNNQAKTFSNKQPDADEFMVRRYVNPRRQRWIYIWAGQVIKELWLMNASNTPLPFLYEGETYEVGTLQQTLQHGNFTYEYYSIKSTNVTGAEDSSVWTFDAFPAELTGYGNPDAGDSKVITEASGNGVVSLAGVQANDPRELYIVFDYSTPKVFMGMFDRAAHQGVGPGVWRDMGDGSNTLDDSYTFFSGSGSVDAYSRTVVGTGTNFTNDFAVGDIIGLENITSISSSDTFIGKAAKVTEIVSNTELKIDRNFPDALTIKIYKSNYNPDTIKDAVIAQIDKD